MATNTLAPNGFQESRSYIGGVPNYATRPEQIAYNYSSKIAFGDPVILASTGVIQLYANGGSTIHGIFVGCEYLDPTTGRFQFSQQWPAPGNLPSTYTVSAKVIVDPFMTFRVQMNGGPVVQADVGNNFDITTSSSGAPNVAGMSTCSLIYSSKATTNTLPFRLVGIIQAPMANYLYDPALANNFVEVRMNTADVLSATGI